MKQRILVFCDFYLPGFKSGGGMWTVVNLVDRFADRYDFFVVTRNYESKGDRTPYTSVRSSEWNTVGKARVFYLAKNDYELKTFVSIVAEVGPSAVFLNSALSTPVVKFLTARRKKLLAYVPVILAPCGEMSVGALSVKPLKKKAFFLYAKTVGLYKDVIWKASSQAESQDIQKMIGETVEVMIASDLAPTSILPDFKPEAKPDKEEGAVRFILVARITRMKNVHFVLERLANLIDGNVELEIVGPIEDAQYWQRCLSLIESCPPNVKVSANPEFIPQEAVLRRMVDNHFFILPTLGENFGYAFIEAMAAGCPLVISDRTGWKDIEARNAGWQISLEHRDLWDETVARCVRMNSKEYGEMSRAARKYALEWLSDKTTEDANASVLETAVSRGSSKASNG